MDKKHTADSGGTNWVIWVLVALFLMGGLVSAGAWGVVVSALVCMFIADIRELNKK